MRKLVILVVLAGLWLLPVDAAGAQPAFPGVIGPTEPQPGPGLCSESSTDLEAEGFVVVFWENAPLVPASIAATLSIDGGAPVDVTSAFDPNPLLPDPNESFQQSDATVPVPGTATSIEWKITVTPEGFAPVTLTQQYGSLNPAGFCAHRFECHPSYEGACVPNIEPDGTIIDVDCATGEGTAAEGDSTSDGPRFVEGPITVVGVDVYGLDGDGDGIACEPRASDPPPAATPAAVRAQPAFTG